MLAFCREIVHNVFVMDELKEIGQGTVSVIAVRRHTGDRSEMVLT